MFVLIQPRGCHDIPIKAVVAACLPRSSHCEVDIFVLLKLLIFLIFIFSVLMYIISCGKNDRQFVDIISKDTITVSTIISHNQKEIF